MTEVSQLTWLADWFESQRQSELAELERHKDRVGPVFRYHEGKFCAFGEVAETVRGLAASAPPTEETPALMPSQQIRLAKAAEDLCRARGWGITTVNIIGCLDDLARGVTV